MSLDNSISIDLFNGPIPDDLLLISRTLTAAGYECSLVGGAVRDMLLYGGIAGCSLTDSDFDFTTNARPDAVQKLFRASRGTKVFTVPTGLKHGTVSVIIEKDGRRSSYEITTYRIDGLYADGRRPDNVTFSDSLTDDLSRRDFTMNAMAYSLETGRLHDPFGGIRDLKERLIRTVGSPQERFSEDGLRPVRACRFSATLGFTIEEETRKAITETLENVSRISAERFQEELWKLLRARKPSIGIEAMRETGILKIFMPEILEGYGDNQNEFHKYDVYYHNLYSCDSADRARPHVRLAALLHDIGKTRAKKYALQSGNGNVFYNHEVIGERMAAKMLKRLKFSNEDTAVVTHLINMHMFYYTEEWTDGAVRRFLRKADGGGEFLQDLFELRRADRLGSGMKSGDAEILDRFRRRIAHILEQDNALKVTDLDINGHDIMTGFSVKPGPIIGEILDHMLDMVLEDPSLNNKETLLKIGQQFLDNYEVISARKKAEKEEAELGIPI